VGLYSGVERRMVFCGMFKCLEDASPYQHATPTIVLPPSSLLHACEIALHYISVEDMVMGKPPASHLHHNAAHAPLSLLLDLLHP